MHDVLDNNFGFNQAFCIDGCEKHTFCGEVVIPDHHLDVIKFYH